LDLGKIKILYPQKHLIYILCHWSMSENVQRIDLHHL